MRDISNTIRDISTYGGSCLNPLLTQDEMKKLLNNEIELNNLSCNIKTAYKMNGKPVSYVDVYKNMPKELKEQVLLVVPIIDMKLIKDLIYNTGCLSEIQKEFYYKTIVYRKELLLDKAFKSLSKIENFI